MDHVRIAANYGYNVSETVAKLVVNVFVRILGKYAPNVVNALVNFARNAANVPAKFRGVFVAVREWLIVLLEYAARERLELVYGNRILWILVAPITSLV